MKICVLGNSHAASIKTGWENIRGDFPDIELVFFAARSAELAGLVVDKDILRAGNPRLARTLAFTSGGEAEIRPADYDCFLLYGLELRLPVLDSALSAAVKRLACRDSLKKTLSYKTASKIRSICAAPIYMGHNPQVASADDQPRSGLLEYAEVFGMASEVLDIEHASLISQPVETIRQGWYTKSEYSKGSTRLDVGDAVSNKPHPEHDNFHMNGEFGRLYLRKLLATLR